MSIFRKKKPVKATPSVLFGDEAINSSITGFINVSCSNKDIMNEPIPFVYLNPHGEALPEAALTHAVVLDIFEAATAQGYQPHAIEMMRSASKLPTYSDSVELDVKRLVPENVIDTFVRGEELNFGETGDHVARVKLADGEIVNIRINTETIPSVTPKNIKLIMDLARGYMVSPVAICAIETDAPMPEYRNGVEDTLLSIGTMQRNQVSQSEMDIPAVIRNPRKANGSSVIMES